MSSQRTGEAERQGDEIGDVDRGAVVDSAVGRADQSRIVVCSVDVSGFDKHTARDIGRVCCEHSIDKTHIHSMSDVD